MKAFTLIIALLIGCAPLERHAINAHAWSQQVVLELRCSTWTEACAESYAENEAERMVRLMAVEGRH